MGKPDIPQDILVAAETAFDLMLCNCIEASGTTEQLRKDSIEPLAHAILAEREAQKERAAKIADQYVWDDHALAQATEIGFAVHHQSVEIAAAIRKGGT